MNANDRRMPWSLVLRDLALLVAAIVFWQCSHVLHDRDVPAAIPLAIVAGLLLTLVAYCAHEWGHLAGALASASRVHFPASAYTVFLFRFDVDANDRRQFLLMSLGGFVASIAVVALLLLTMQPRYLADAIALGLSAIGVLATLVLEVPTFFKVWRGAPLPRGAAYFSTRR